MFCLGYENPSVIAWKKLLLFILISIQNTPVHCVGRTELLMLNLVHIVTTGLYGVKTVPVADSVIDLTADSPVSTLPVTEQTNQSVITLDDTIDESSPVKQTR